MSLLADTLRQMKKTDEATAKLDALTHRYTGAHTDTDAPALTRAQAVTRCIADVPAEALVWLWPGRIPLGKLTILSGDPGLGKSLVTLAVVAAVSRGAAWPCREGTAPLGDVVLISAEDDPADTIRPRLEAAGADLRRVQVLDSVEFADEDGHLVRRPWNFTDTDALDARLAALPGCSLVVVDPLSAYLAGTDSHKNSDVRALLVPLAEMASRRRVAVLCVSHLNKSSGPAMYRTSGSLAFVAAARAVYAVAKDQNDASRRLVVPIKSNLAPDGTGLAYRIGMGQNGAPLVEWEPETVSVTAEEALAVERYDGEQRERREAVEWLRELLEERPLTAKEVRQNCTDAGMAWRTVQRAAREAGVKSRRGGFGGAVTWSLPIRANTSQSRRVGANGACGANVENTGLAGASQPTIPHSRQVCGRGANDMQEGEL